MRASSRWLPSALLTVTTSASSSTPFLIPCSESPVRASISTRNVSVRLATVVSDWPTPTVSTSTTSYPAASTMTIASRVAVATPPSVPDVGDGRMNASGSTARRSMRVLSPRMLPPVRVDDGSTASTATRRPSPVSFVPSASMNVDLPTPGTPVMPTRWLAIAFGSKRVSSSSASGRWSGWVDSTSVIAWPR